jgi:hypothetical protein
MPPDQRWKEKVKNVAATAAASAAPAAVPRQIQRRRSSARGSNVPRPASGKITSVSIDRRKNDRASPCRRVVRRGASSPKLAAIEPTSRSMGEPSCVAEVR